MITQSHKSDGIFLTFWNW